MSSKVAIQMIVFSDEVKQKGFEPVFKFIHELGVREVELSKVPVNAQTINEITSLFDKYDLHACALNANFDPADNGVLSVKEDLPELVEYCHLLNCEYLRIGSLPAWTYGREAETLRYAKQLNEIGEKLSKEDIKFYHHHHTFEFQKYHGKYGLELVLENTDPEYVGIELDTHWLQFAGLHPQTWIRKLKGRADIVHLKDYRVVMPSQDILKTITSGDELRMVSTQFAEIGTGNLDMKDIIQTCIDVGVKYMPIEQDTSYDLSPYESIEKSVTNIKKYGFENTF